MDENSIKRIQPHSKKAEQSVIGAMLMDSDAISQIEPILTKDDFYVAQYGILYETILELYNENVPVDTITVPERLKSKGVPDEIGSASNIRMALFPILLIAFIVVGYAIYGIDRAKKN